MSRLLGVVKTAFRRRPLRKEEGASLAEYGLLLGLIALICIAALSILGTKISSMFSTLSSSM